MVKKTHRKKIRVGKNKTKNKKKTIKKIKGGVDICDDYEPVSKKETHSHSDEIPLETEKKIILEKELNKQNLEEYLILKTFFMTQDKNLAEKLGKLGITQSPTYNDNLTLFQSQIEDKDKDLCKGNAFMHSFITSNITNPLNNIIYINNGYRVSGLLNFIIDNAVIILDSICVPSESKPGTGTFLLSLLKRLSNDTGYKIILTAENERCYSFYEANGFVKPNTTPTIFSFSSRYTYTPPESKGGKLQKKKTKKLTRNENQI
jgi:hypothetical protein